MAWSIICIWRSQSRRDRPGGLDAVQLLHHMLRPLTVAAQVLNLVEVREQEPNDGDAI